MATLAIDHTGPFKIGIVVGSQRAGRICPQVSQFVLDIIKSHHQSTAKADQPELDFSLLDIADFNLPLTDEREMPAHIKDIPAGYATETTRAWSTAVSVLDAFVFVTPQYNWGIPAALKNALDHLFNEFAGKPAAVVSYGGHGGGQSAAMLITVLTGMFMRVVKKPVCLRYPDQSFLKSAIDGESLGLDAKEHDGTWADQKRAIVGLWEEALALLTSQPVLRPTVRSPGLLELWEMTISPMAAIEAKHASGTVPPR